MDYLDPRKRRIYNAQLVIGYILVAIVIGLATVIIVYGANGYGINTKTGQIVENALLFVDSTPGGAEIYLNGKDQNTTTSARLVLPAGNYTLTIKKDGYKDWSRKFTLNGQSVARYVYPFLFPAKPLETGLKTYHLSPGMITETPDRKWLLVENQEAGSTAPVFDELDTSTLDKSQPVFQQITLPANDLTNYSADSRLEEVEWSTDNNNLLLKHSFAGGSEYIVFNRSRPDQSFNVNKLFNVSPVLASLFNKKADQLYMLDQGGNLLLGNVGSQTTGQPLLKNVLAFKPYGKDLITYVTDKNEPDGKVAARIWDSGQTYKLYEFSAGNKYLVDAAQFQGHFYYIAGSDTSGRINVYKDPLTNIKNPAVGKAIGLLSLDENGAQKAGFSDNARFIGVENGQAFAVYDFETGSAYEYSISEPLAENMAWMDGHRFIGNSGGKVFIMDYDGTNKQLLPATDLPLGGLFNTDYRHLLILSTSPGGSTVILQDIDMRAGKDLPKSKQ